MKLKINGNYYTDESGTPIELGEIIKGYDYLKLYQDGSRIALFGGLSDMSIYTVEDGEFTPAPPDNLTSCDQDSMLLTIATGGTISDTDKERLCARQIHDGKMEYPSGIPAGISVKNVYDAYTFHYQFKPDIEEPTE